MAEGKKIMDRLAPLLARYEGEPALFGTQVKKMLETIKKVGNGKGVKSDEPSALH